MKISEGVEWGMHCLVLLAQLPADATLAGKALAEYHGVSETYLAKHLQALVNAGLIVSVSGPKGGYRLARPAAAITMLAVVDAIEGRAPLFRCTEIRQRGPVADATATYRLPCAIHAGMLRAEKAWRAELQAQTVADLVMQVERDVDQRGRQRAAAWRDDRARR